MKIYKQEIIDGIQEKILSNASIAYCSKVEPIVDKALALAVESAMANVLQTREGLYPTRSILVSTVWNLNDDVFDKEEVWIAKSTPKDKPTNIEHDEKQIAGHITDCMAFDNDGKVIADNIGIDELPDIYHLVNGAVIYTIWQDKALAERTQKLIAEIEAGTKYVSMECMFHGFDYAVISPDKTYHVVARNSETAFLTKHLRAYGGTGQYDGHRVGRLLRNIVFSGKGYVDQPANPQSIILKGEDFAFSSIRQNTTIFNDTGVCIFSTAENKDMDLEKQIAELNGKVTSLQGELTSSKSSIESLTKNVATLEASLAGANKEVESLKQANTGLTEQLTEAGKKSESLIAELKAANEKSGALATELSTIKAENLKVARVSSLVSSGISKEEAEKKVAIFAALTDEQFAAVAEALVAGVKTTTKPEQDIDHDDAEGNADANVDLKNKGNDINPTVDDAGEGDNAVRASISDWLKNEIGISKE